MQPILERFLKPLFESEEAAKSLKKKAVLSPGEAALLEAKRKEIHPECNEKDYLIMLLHINADIEHGLMIQYLYAAYSLGGPHIPEEYRDKVRSWQETILGIAKEEMGHLISVQNILKLIGAPLCFARENFPWSTPFYPFPFKLEPLTLDSLAKYVYAESPEKVEDPVAQEIKKKLEQEGGDPHRVGELFDKMLDLVKDEILITDDVFQMPSYSFQAKYDEWGRGYKGGERGNTLHGSPAGTPDVLVAALTCRDDVVSSLESISEQGEAPSEDTGSPSHFLRFLNIYKEVKALSDQLGENWQPSRNIAINPVIGEALGESGDSIINGSNIISDPHAQGWAHLFNIRYNLLLKFLIHSFVLDDGISTERRSPRATVINATFGEMYNLRSIAFILVKTPLAKDSQKMAGPPFLMPYTLELPTGEYNRWRQHKDLLEAAGKLITKLLAVSDEGQRKYLLTLREADRKLMQIIEELLSIPAH